MLYNIFRKKEEYFMKKVLYILALCTAVLFLTGCKSVPSRKSILAKNYSEAIEKSRKYLNSKDFSGTILIAYDGEILYADAFGLRDRYDDDSEPIAVDDRLEIGSLTKQFTSACLMQLIEKGKLSVDDTLDKFFPDYTYGNQITIKNLLTMRSGISSVAYYNKEVDDAVKRAYEEDDVFTADFWIYILNKYPLTFTPGSQAVYNNLNYCLLAKVVEQVSGMTYEQYLEQNIFTPLGMTRTNKRMGGIDVKPYQKNDKDVPDSYSFGAGDINSTVYDMNKWIYGLVNGKVVSKKTVNEMTFARKEETPEYGYGLMTDGRIITHSGSTAGYNSFMAYNYDTKITVIALMNKKPGVVTARTLSLVVEDYFTQTAGLNNL